MVIRLCFISFLKLQYIASVPLFAPNGQCTNCTNINCKLAHKYTLTVYVSAAVCLRIHHSTPVLCHFPSVSSLYRAIKPCVISQTLPYFTSIVPIICSNTAFSENASMKPSAVSVTAQWIYAETLMFDDYKRNWISASFQRTLRPGIRNAVEMLNLHYYLAFEKILHI